MLIDTTEVQDINSFSRLESLKEVYGIIWMLVPIFTPVLGITIGDFLSTKEHDITSKYVFVAKNWEALVSCINFVLYVVFHT
ncbi:hypothetical protein Pint_25209 [Pistacia integerrima]|uniref:Uncharacterized protein n=1 Tax=Pistacia integerrima TaxID=434235 RepID=A0ACC0YGD3_9ROSI|nr:hypothetical protein Pint_25209 [Pistacia integerrima]